MNATNFNIFTSLTGVTHRRIGNASYALACNSRNTPIKGTPSTVESVEGRKLCTKCFPGK